MRAVLPARHQHHAANYQASPETFGKAEERILSTMPVLKQAHLPNPS
jgi:hypothetical protein